MHLFGDHGFGGTSVAAIEAAAGLTPGAGGLYHHFPSKDAVLRAGMERHLGRLGALRDIRRLFGGLGDLRVELTVTARYVLAELDAEADLLRIVLAEGRRRPDLVQGAAATLVAATYAEFAAMLHEEWAVPVQRAAGLAAMALGSLISHRLVRDAVPDHDGPDDDALVAVWVDTLHRAICA